MGRDVGALGESVLEKWANEVGIIANRSLSKDETGWDFILEFPIIAKATDCPLDKAPYPLKCLIQVKSTDHKPGRRSIKLSNMMRMVKTNDPTFFLYFEFDGNNDPQRSYLVHVGEDIIKRVLYRLRKISCEGIHELHKHTMDVIYKSSDILSSNDGEGLQKSLLKHVQVNPEIYSQIKADIIENIGYDNNKRKNINFLLKLPKGKEDLIDLFLGRIPDVELTQGEIYDVRFGIPQIERVFRESGRFSAKPHETSNGTIRISLPNDTSDHEISVKVAITPLVIASLGDPLFTIRLYSDYIDIIYRPYGNYAKYNFSLPDPTTDTLLSNLHPVAESISLIKKARDINEKLCLELFVDDQLIGTLYVNTNEVNTTLLKYADIVENIWIVAKHLDIQNILMICISNLLPYESMIKFLADTISHIPQDLKVSFSTEEPIDTNIVCIPLINRILFGQFQICFAIALLGNVVDSDEPDIEDENRLMVIPDKIQIVKLYKEAKDIDSKYSDSFLMDAVRTRYDKDDITVIII
ncbi:MAG: hypothetical protein ACYDCO_04065 [Armatimonadota bacterium]